MGIPLSDWFVCLHVRESGYHSDDAKYLKTHRQRNASIENYTLAIERMIREGGWVIRLGDPMMKRLPPMDKVIDYAHSPFRSELMDLYLVSQCRFYLGMNSGPVEFAWLFQKRVVMTNDSEWLMAFPFKREDLVIFKHVFSKSQNRFLSLDETLEIPLFQNGEVNSLDNRDYIMYENSPVEIDEVVEECLRNDPASPQELQDAFKQKRIRQIHHSFERLIQRGPLTREMIHQMYRITSRVESPQGNLGARFLAENWHQNVNNLKNVAFC